MIKRTKIALLAAALLAAPAMLAPQAAVAQATKPVFVQGSMNIFRRFAPDIRTKMLDYYGNVLGLQALQPIQLNASTQMILYRVGATGQIKLASGLMRGRTYHPGGAINDATGIRLLTFHFADDAALTARLTAAGYPAPAFKDIGNGRRAAIVKDPGDFNIELVIDPKASPQTTGGVDVGINVTDLARSRAFYRDFAGLDELPPVKDDFLGVTKYPFRHGETTITLWSAGKGLPQDNGSAGIQYVVNNVPAMNDRAKAENVTVETPLGGVPGFNVMTVWLNDPDGVTNYFYQMGPRPAGATPAATPAPAQ
jgi:catechol 2,3-dioxygenase-like lactoylglutathione lyase family enzyme